MATITFQAHIMNGMIEIPAMYRDQFPDTIQVLVMATPCPEPTGILDRLLLAAQAEGLEVDSPNMH